MKLADILSGKLKGAKRDPNALHRDTLKRLLRLSDAEVSELSLALRALSDDDDSLPPISETSGAKKAPALADVLGSKGSAKGS